MRIEEFKEILAEFNVQCVYGNVITYHRLHIGYYTEELQNDNTHHIVGHFWIYGKNYTATNKTEFRDCLNKTIMMAKELENKEKLVKMKQDFL